MKTNNYKPQIPDVMEAIFDAAYLIFDLTAAILFFIFSQGNMLFILYGILTLTLCGGDAFHLVPRIIRAVRGSNDKIKRQLGIGLQISSITMTVFYRKLPDFLVKKTLHKQLTFDKKHVCFKITNSARYEWGSRYGKRKERNYHDTGKMSLCREMWSLSYGADHI